MFRFFIKNWKETLLLLFLFGLWALGAMYYYYYNIQERDYERKDFVDSTAIATNPHTLYVQKGDDSLLTGYPQLRFNYATTTPVWEEEHREFLVKIAELLRTVPSYTLHIEGYCTQEEYEVTYRNELYQNLGFARALGVAEKLRVEHQVDMNRIVVEGVIQDSILSMVRFWVEGDEPFTNTEDSISSTEPLEEK